ncbi:MAG: PhoH family protein [Desulfurococcales archaeon]|nr:PhoH family protein [Desulfurococcales archaeon]
MIEVLEKVQGKTERQRELVRAIRDRSVELVGAFGPSGTGKSFLTLTQALLLLGRGEYEKLVVGRPVIGVTFEERISSGGSIEAYKEHVREYILDIVGSLDPSLREHVDKLISTGKIEIIDPVFLRGRTFDRSIIFVDDIQNTTIEAVIEAITRVGIDSKLIIAGDPVFQHLYPGASRTAVEAWEILRGERGSAVIDLGISDVVRPGARRGLRLLLESALRRRRMSETERRVYDAIRLYAPDADVITVISLVDAKKRLEIESSHVPDVVIIVKPGHVARTIGTGGERIERVEEDTGLMPRVVELTLDFKQYIRAVHPVSWIHKHVVHADLAGPYVVVRVPQRYLGAILGQKGVYARFMDLFFRELLGIGFRVEEARKRS